MRFRVSLRMDRPNADLTGARFQMRPEAASNRRRIAPEHHRIDEGIDKSIAV